MDFTREEEVAALKNAAHAAETDPNVFIEHSGDVTYEHIEATYPPLFRGLVMKTHRTHNLADIDVNDLPTVRKAVEDARAVGHWRRILAIYGDHLPACAVRSVVPGAVCDCGFATAFDA